MTRTIGKAKADYQDDNNWKDTGCAFEDSCLNCHRETKDCPEENGHVYMRDKKQRRRSVIEYFIARGESYRIPKELGISPSTIQRDLRG